MAMSRVEVLRALTMLCELGLMTRAQVREGKETDKPVYQYELVKKIGAVHLASAAHLGLDTEALEKHRAVTKKEKKVQEMYQCPECMTVYNSEYGDISQGIEKGVLFKDLPEDYCCSLCESPKINFIALTGEKLGSL